MPPPRLVLELVAGASDCNCMKENKIKLKFKLKFKGTGLGITGTKRCEMEGGQTTYQNHPATFSWHPYIYIVQGVNNTLSVGSTTQLFTLKRTDRHVSEM